MKPPASLTNLIWTRVRYSQPFSHPDSTIAESNLIHRFIPLNNAPLGGGKTVSHLLLAATFFSGSVLAQSVSKPNEVTVDWNKTVIVSSLRPPCK